MQRDYWQKQSVEKPLFPDILWEKPERRDLAGKLLIVGGSIGGIHDISLSFQTAVEAGAGEVRVLVPESLKKLTKHIPGIGFLASTGKGTFAREGLDDLLYAAQWADSVLLAGGIGRNSESALLFADFLRSWAGQLVITKDAVDILYSEADYLMKREKTLLAVSLGQLQRLAKEIRTSFAFSSDMDFLILIEKLHDLSKENRAFMITKHHDHLLAANDGRVATMDRKDLAETWCVEIATRSAVYLTHHPNQDFEAVASALL